jgi:transcriptional regulator with XRE-family HTH domain
MATSRRSSSRTESPFAGSTSAVAADHGRQRGGVPSPRLVPCAAAGRVGTRQAPIDVPSKYIPQRSCPLSRRSYDPIVPPGRSMRVGSASVVRTPNRRLRGLRERRCESRAEFAGALRRQAAAMGENMAIGERQVARWERGEVRWPRAAYRRVLSALLGVEVDALGFEPPQEVAEAMSQAPRSQLPMRRLVGAPTTPVAPRLRESAGRGRSGFTCVSPDMEAASAASGLPDRRQRW